MAALLRRLTCQKSSCPRHTSQQASSSKHGSLKVASFFPSEIRYSKLPDMPTGLEVLGAAGPDPSRRLRHRHFRCRKKLTWQRTSRNLPNDPKPTLATTARLHAVRHPSEVRLVCARNVGLVVVIILMGVFGTDPFRQLVGPWHVSQGRGPGRREDAFILDRHSSCKNLPRCWLKISPADSQFSFLFLSIASFTSS